MDSDLGRILSDGKKIAFRNILLQTKQPPSPNTLTHAFALLHLIVGDRLVIHRYSFVETFPKIV